MLFKDGEQFKEAICKYSRCSRRELKFIKNEPNRVNAKCNASTHCPWRIYAITNRMTKCMQVRTFVEEHSCPVSFKNKNVNVKAIAEHFEKTIKDHPKMKLKEIYRKVQSELHVNVNFSACRRAKNLVSSRLAENVKEEFTNL
ncbi:MUSTANG 7 [Hibiscus trionum]|uniref:MUSTANG 7 n=1 Tax=Hibiscus trionum TaxID=183268 RepID=A0A9W7HFF0_HIBTR|nr:MUSTANG 7 [Hibiscus trionum]